MSEEWHACVRCSHQMHVELPCPCEVIAAPELPLFDEMGLGWSCNQRMHMAMRRSLAWSGRMDPLLTGAWRAHLEFDDGTSFTQSPFCRL